ncbi:MAG: hypothetical protein M1830_010703 [Pleopsidium flavum]|nr:MAG: hypothetical protein M1830_010703 [Pleopsidium flavum]
MKSFFILSLLSLSLSILPSTAAPIPILTNRDINSIADTLLFHTSMSAFLAAKAALNPSYLVWTDDGCSKSPDRPEGFNFLDSCKRHDFGYRNYKVEGRFTEANRALIDKNLKNDLYHECDTYSGWQSYKGVECRRIADVYYEAVRAFGNSQAHIPAIPGL